MVNKAKQAKKETYVFIMIHSILDQTKQRRLTSKGNPRLDTLALIAKDLNSELMLIPKEKIGAEMALLEQERFEQDKVDVSQINKPQKQSAKKSLSDDPWQDLLGNES